MAYLEDYAAALGNQVVERSTSVSMRSDRVLEQASNLRTNLYSLLSQLKQLPQEAKAETPCRCGLDGKLQDASDHLNLAQSIIEDLAQYLVG